MTNSFWKRVRGGTSGSRIFGAYLALVLMVAMAGPGLAVYAADGDAAEPPPAAEEPVVEAPAVEAPVAEAPVVEAAPVVEEAPIVEVPAVEPVAEPVVVALASIEAPLTVAVAIVTPPATSADPSDLGVIPTVVGGNPALCVGGLRVDPGKSGTYPIPGYPGMFLTVVVTSTDDGPVFSFDSDVPVVRVVAKGGTLGANVYLYDPAVDSDGSLHSPINPSGDYAGLSHIDFCFGKIEEPETGDILVHKYEDLNGDGILDPGEPALEDWEFALLDSEAVELDSGLTDADGELPFTGLEPDEYDVTETLQAGWTNTTPLTQAAVVVAGETTELWFGNKREVIPPEKGSLLIHKYEDLNGDGIHDPGEPALENWEFTVVDGESAEIGSGFTDVDGELGFTELLLGTYTVTETLQAGWLNTTPLSQDAQVVANQTAELWFGNQREVIPPEMGNLVIHKFEDLNEDGIHDPGEPPLQNWEFTVTLETPPIAPAISPAAIMLIGSGLTDVNGELSFMELLPDTYTVTETLQAGWENSTPLVQMVQVVANETTHVWFGNFEPTLPFTELDLAITKVADDHTVTEGQLVTYTLTYWNNGDLPAENYTIVDDFDERYVTVVNANGGVVAGGKITWTLAGPLTKAMGMQTLTYTVRVIADMPDGTTNIDNVVVISHPRDTNPTNNTDNERVVHVGEPFLPFTGGEYLLLIGFAVAASAIGLLFRLRTDSAA